MSGAESPVFVTGIPRSGKTLLSMLIAAHPSLAIPRQETYFWKGFYGRYGDLSLAANLERCAEAMLRDSQARGFMHRFDWIRERFGSDAPSYGRLFATFMEDFADQSSKPRWGCHSQQIEDCIEIILRSFPQARFIHMIRDPRDRYAAQLLRDSSMRASLGQLSLQTSLWLRSADRAIDSQRRYPAHWMLVKYEALVRCPEETLTSVLTFLTETPIPVAQALDELSRVRDKFGKTPFGSLSTAQVGIYRQQLSAREISLIQRLASAKMQSLGYHTDEVELSLLDHIALNGLDRPVGVLRRLASRVRRAVS